MARRSGRAAGELTPPRASGPAGRELDEAVRAWRRFGRGERGRRRQLELLREVVADRSHELIRAYANLGAVGHGDRLTDGQVEREPCLVFYVERKLSERSSELAKDQVLPPHVFTHASVDRKRRRIAIPTDVREGAGRTAFRAQSAPRAKVRARSERRSVLGTPTAVVRLRNASGELLADRFLLSCLHVLGVTEHDHPEILAAAVERTDDAPIGTTTRKTGSLVPAASSNSFDAALAVVDDVDALRRALPRQPTARIHKYWQVPPSYTVWTERGPLPAARLGFLEGASALVIYDTPDGDLLTTHRELVESRVDTHSGDSGSPVVSTDGTQLIGMHIAGARDRALMIPAYDLIGRPFEFRGLSARWKIEFDRTFR